MPGKKTAAALTTICVALGAWYIGRWMYVASLSGVGARPSGDEEERCDIDCGEQRRRRHTGTGRRRALNCTPRRGGMTVRISEYLWRRLCSITGSRAVGTASTPASSGHGQRGAASQDCEPSREAARPAPRRRHGNDSVRLRHPVDWLQLSPVLNSALLDDNAESPCGTRAGVSGRAAADPCAANVQRDMEDRKLPAVVDLRQFSRVLGLREALKLWSEIEAQLAVFNPDSSLAVAVPRYPLQSDGRAPDEGYDKADSGDAAGLFADDVRDIPWARCFTLRIVCGSCARAPHMSKQAQGSGTGTQLPPMRQERERSREDDERDADADADGKLAADVPPGPGGGPGVPPAMQLTVEIGVQEWMSVRDSRELLRDVVVTRVMPRLMRLVPCFTRAMASSIVRVVRGFFLPTAHDADPLFVDVLPLLANPRAHAWLLDRATQFVGAVEREHGGMRVTAVAALEARGFMFGIGLATRLGLSFVPLRRPGRYPGRLVIRQEFTKASGPDALELDGAVLGEGERVLIVDDLLVSGGSMLASDLVLRSAGARVCGAFVPFEVEDGEGRQNLWRFQAHWPVYSAICVTSLEDAPRIEDIRDARVLLDGAAADAGAK